MSNPKAGGLWASRRFKFALGVAIVAAAAIGYYLGFSRGLVFFLGGAGAGLMVFSVYRSRF